MNNTYFNSDNTTSEEKEETTFDKLKELTQEVWELFKDYCGFYISAIDFMKDVCDNINTFIDGHLEDNKEFFAKFNEEHPILSIIFIGHQWKSALGDATLKFAKDMTFGLGSDVLGMLSYEYHGLLENPGETLSENMESLLMIKAILLPTSKEEFEIQDRVLSGIWEDIKADFNSEVINGNPYTASRYVYNLAIEIGSLFYGAGELKAAAGIKKADNVIDGVRVIDKVSDAGRLNSSRINYLRSKYGKFTSEQINNRINLRGAVDAEIDRLYKSGLSRKEIGPAVAGVFDSKTYKYYFAINNIEGDVPGKLHPLIKERIDNMHQKFIIVMKCGH